MVHGGVGEFSDAVQKGLKYQMVPEEWTPISDISLKSGVQP